VNSWSSCPKALSRVATIADGGEAGASYALLA
jgi:hypothetical protein